MKQCGQQTQQRSSTLSDRLSAKRKLAATDMGAGGVSSGQGPAADAAFTVGGPPTLSGPHQVSKVGAQLGKRRRSCVSMSTLTAEADGATHAVEPLAVAAELHDKVSQLCRVLDEPASSGAALLGALHGLRELGPLPDQVVARTGVGRSVAAAARRPAAPSRCAEAAAAAARQLLASWRREHRRRKTATMFPQTSCDGPEALRGELGPSFDNGTEELCGYTPSLNASDGVPANGAAAAEQPKPPSRAARRNAMRFGGDAQMLCAAAAAAGSSSGSQLPSLAALGPPASPSPSPSPPAWGVAPALLGPWTACLEARSRLPHPLHGALPLSRPPRRPPRALTARARVPPGHPVQHAEIDCGLQRLAHLWPRSQRQRLQRP
eukprot:SRR837773.10012.p1 GENE.SRR837773.10012~~SRR837773.10012.p1  ORF type:complete len:378 (-),score=-10.72 SRR837773.10012:136-1269(-)